MKIRTAIRLLICRFRGHVPQGWITWTIGKKRHTKRIFYRCERCGRRV
jgi:hypothetical protein